MQVWSCRLKGGRMRAKFFAVRGEEVVEWGTRVTEAAPVARSFKHALTAFKAALFLVAVVLRERSRCPDPYIGTPLLIKPFE